MSMLTLLESRLPGAAPVVEARIDPRNHRFNSNGLLDEAATRKAVADAVRRTAEDVEQSLDRAFDLLRRYVGAAI